MGKKLSSQGTSCLENCFVGVFKHLIHIFGLTIVIAFVAMLFVVKDNKTDNMGLR
jgi:hypothetical protein